MSGDEVDLRLWGKSRGLAERGHGRVMYPAICHLLDAAAMAGAIWDDYLSFGLRRWLSEELGVSQEQCREFVMLLAGIHDIGKLCPGFQRKVEVPDGYPLDGECTDHARAGHLWLGAVLQHEFNCSESTAVRIGEIVGGHHGVFTTQASKDFLPKKMPSHGIGIGLWGRQRRTTLKALLAVLGDPFFPVDISRPAQTVACATVILADWLASRTEYVRSRLGKVPERGDAVSLKRFFSDASAGAADELRQVGLKRLTLKPGTFAEEFEFVPNRLQASLEADLPQLTTGPGLLIVAEETGCGKTEAALYAARGFAQTAGTAGTCFLLPTMATSNAMEPRLGEYLQRRAIDSAPLSLLHSMAWLRRLWAEKEIGDEVSSEAADILTTVTEWLSGAKKAAFAPVGVGTVDQALLSVLPVKHNAFRMLAFANKTVVVDEVHAFDSYVEGLLATFLAWCGELRVPVILMSATLPQEVGRRLAAAYVGRPRGTELPVEVPYPGWAFIDLDSGNVESRQLQVSDAEQQTLRIDTRPCASTDAGIERLPALRAELEPMLHSFGSAAIVCTTVNEAQQTYRDLRLWCQQQEFDVELILLHARMPLWQREQITDDVTARFGKNGDRSGRTVIVSTQVLEQSVDIDMDLVISDLAPFELLLQRAGRGHRHPENSVSRPQWAQERRFVVLTPEGGWNPGLPPSWTYVYPPASLIRTQRLLLREASEGVRIPGDVQRLVDAARTDSELIAGYEKADTTSRANKIMQSGEAARRSVPRPADLEPIGSFSAGAHRIDDDVVSTRLADSVRTLPCFRHDGQLFLDAACQLPLPQPRWRSGRPVWTQDELGAVVERTVPVGAFHLDEAAGPSAQPESWQRHRLLNRIVVLPQDVDESGEVQPARVGKRRFKLDPMLGLLIN